MHHRCLRLLGALFLCMLMGLAHAAVEANHATSLDLESIKGIGPSTAAKILAQRQARPFADWQDFIERVPGIGPKRAARMSEGGLTVNGQRFHAAKPIAIAPRTGPKLPPPQRDPFPSGSMLVEWPAK